MAGGFSPPPALLLLLLLLLRLALVTVSIAQEYCDPRCSTQNCDSDGVCICELPRNSTMLLGDRPFLGGEFCDTRMTMCDGSNSFWCENGLCNEMVQGENYTCVCKEGYAGEHCEVEGVPCGDLYCYHGAECIQADAPCDCPPDWQGSQDCSKPTTKSSTYNTDVDDEHVKTGGQDKWYLLPLSVAAAVVVVAGIVVVGAKMSLRKRSSAATEFHKLQQVQMPDFVDEDEAAFAHAPLSKAELA